MQLQVGIIKIEVSLPEATRAIGEFRRNRIKAFEAISAEVRSAVGGAINQLLQAEMSIFLGRPDQDANKRNGYQEREYALKGIGCVRIRMPVDRRRKFKSEIIRPNEQVDPRLKEDMAVLHLAGLSKRTLAMMSKRVLGVELSRESVSQSLELVKPKALAFLERNLSDRKFWALYIDGTNFKVQRRGSTEKEPSLVVLGIDAKNSLSLLAIEPGTKDNVEAWRAVFSSLASRGLDFQAVRVGVMDGLPGLEKLFRETYPKAVTQRCWVHALRNALAKAPHRHRDAFKRLAQRVMYAGSANGARLAFQELKATMGSDGERAVHCLEKDLDSLLAHYQFEKPLWRALKTTNPVERVNRELKRRTKSMDSLGEQTLNVLLAFTALRLEYGWATTRVDLERFEHLVSVKRINQFEQAAADLLH
jgi:transposase-like protein